jgi:hypothetical protein
VILVGCLAQQAQRELVREQFLEGEAALRRMATLGQLRDVRIGRWAVHVAHRLLERRQVECVQHAGGHIVGDGAAREQRQRQVGQGAQPALLHAFGRRVNRRQRFGRGATRLRQHAPVFGVHDFETARSQANLTKAAESRAPGELGLLRGGKMKEPQRDEARAVGQPDQQRAPLAKDHLGQLDFALDDGAVAGAQGADR